MNFNQAVALAKTVDGRSRLVILSSIERLSPTSWGVFVRVSWDRYPRMAETREQLEIVFHAAKKLEKPEPVELSQAMLF